MKKAWVTTILRQEIEVPDDWERENIYDFLGEYQSFRGAFQGLSNLEENARIVDIMVLEEEVTELGEESFDA
jgi:hypothetical protein